MQETFLTVSRKASSFEPGTNFVAWACGIARLKVLEHFRQKKRGNVLSEAAISALAVDAPSPQLLSEIQDALEACLAKLTPKIRDLLWRRYSRRRSSDEMAEGSRDDLDRSSRGALKSSSCAAGLHQLSTPTGPVKVSMTDNINNGELDALIDACLDGQLSDAEAERLSQWIEESSEARERYWELASVHGLIEQSVQAASVKAATGEEMAQPLQAEGPARRPRINAVAAGMVIGILSASLGWAYAIPLVNQTRRESTEIVFEDFEDPEMKPLLGRFPTSANRWFGRILSVPGKDGITTVSGTRVGQFKHVAQNQTGLRPLPH